MPVFAALETPDLIVLGICVVLAIRGAIKGFTWQLIRTSGLIGALWLAGQLNDDVGTWINAKFDSFIPDGTQNVAAWFVLLVLAWLIVTFVAYMAKGAVHKANLSGMDRALGLVLGALMGFVIATAVFVGYGRVVSEKQLVDTLEGSLSARVMAQVIDHALPLVPEPVATDWSETFDAIKTAGDDDSDA